MENFETYEKEVERIKKQNEEYLNAFSKYLEAEGFVDKTIRKHIFNVSFYIDDYLNYYDAQEMDQGCYQISSFFDNWFIRKAMWSSEANIKASCASIKKFYKFMLENEKITILDYKILCETIKAEKASWLKAMRDYERSYY